MPRLCICQDEWNLNVGGNQDPGLSRCVDLFVSATFLVVLPGRDGISEMHWPMIGLIIFYFSICIVQVLGP